MIKNKSLEKEFQKWNRILGWLVFTIALTVYSITVEPTNSFWDVGEYISTSSKLQIGHPPGAPLFQMIGAFASMFATSKEKIAYAINMTSVISSAFTILFLFWSITMLLKKVVVYQTQFSKHKMIAILGSSSVGSLVFTFTDSFWFNAVEAEVYAMATLILALLFYLGLLWERDMDTPRGNKWIVLISLIIGLSFGVHFMGILSIPAIGLLYYFKKYKKITLLNFLTANVIVSAILVFIFKLLLPYTLHFFSASEIFCVNTLGLPFHSGIIIAGVIFILCFYFGLSYTRKKGFLNLNTIFLCILFILIGFSSWVMLPIRATAGTVINENDPNNARELLAYYNLEQYPSVPLFYGPQFTEIYSHLDTKNPYEDEKPKYEKDIRTGKYIVVNDWKNARQNLNDNHKSILPRMWSTEHIGNYMIFTGPIRFTIKPEYQDQEELLTLVTRFRKDYAIGKVDNKDYNDFLQKFGNYLDVEKPGLWDNLEYLFEYQIGYMYWRYFMWNFVGRQNDVQGEMDKLNGNWLSGIKFIDELRLGSQENLPSNVLKNKARNTYYFLPLLLGLLGLIFHLKKDKKNFWAVLAFFLFTGIALKIYLNEKPFEVRERDYALVGSFYAFAIWIGFGTYALYDLLKDSIRSKIILPLIIMVSLISIPGVLAAQNWDDHDRSNKYTASTMPKMYLSSCQENAILFTIGDNDTFSLWYSQEIENYRTDVRTVVAGYLSTDWYTDQMKKTAYKSPSLPISFSHDFYRYGNNGAIYYQSITEDTMLIKNWMHWIKSDDPRTKGDLQSGKKVNTFPTKHIRIPVDKKAVLRNGIVVENDADKIVPYIDIHLKGDYLLKHRLIMLDIIANNNWERPIYFSGGSYGDDDYLWMKDYLQLDGLVYKLVPIKTEVNPKNPYEYGRIDPDLMYPIVMNWDWGNTEDLNIYHDPVTRRNSISCRISLGRLAGALIDEGKNEMARDILDLGMKKMPIEYYEYYTPLKKFVTGYFKIYEIQKARQLWKQIVKKYQEKLYYYGNLPIEEQYEFAQEIVLNIEYYKDMIELLKGNDNKEEVESKINEFNKYLWLFKSLYEH